MNDNKRLPGDGPATPTPYDFEPSPLPPPQVPPPLVPPRLPLPPRLLPRAMKLILPEMIYCPIRASGDSGMDNCWGARCAAYRPAHADWGYCKLIDRDGGAA